MEPRQAEVPSATTELAGELDTPVVEIAPESSTAELMGSGAVPAPVDLALPRPVVMPGRATRVRSKRFRNRFLRDLSIGALLVVMTHIFLVQVSIVRGSSMSPSLFDGDRLMVDRLVYSVADVSRFDVVVLRYPKNPDVDFVKRIVGLPGDRVELRNGLIHVNGESLPEEFAHVADRNATGSWLVPDQSFFVLGDNRPISCDSREFGMVDRDLLKGKVRVIFWPLDRFTLF